jgi:putative nucleotidyltransferase with HDIG domain
MAKTILFVDEEQFVLKALQRSLRKMRTQWDMRFASNPIEAAKTLEAIPVDVLITETVFAGQSGLELLKLVREKIPHIVRIILSGYADRDVILKSVDLAHQYLAKPCEDKNLQEAIVRAFLMKDLLEQGSLKEIVTRIDSLPSLPSIYVELVEELKSEDASMQKVGDIIAKDIGLTAKVLKLVNSSFFGMPQQIINPAKAASLLGLDLIKAIVLTSATFDKFKKLKFHGFSIDQLWDHAMTVASFGKAIAAHVGMDRKETESAFMSGLLHDVGKLLVAAYLPDKFVDILKLMRNEAISMSAAETRIVGTTHAAIGAYLLGLWGLPAPIIDAAAFHHEPSKKSINCAKPLLIVHVANAFAQNTDKLHDNQGIVEGVDYPFLKAAGVLEQLENWRRVCADFIG